MTDSGRSVALGLLLGSSALFGYHAFSALRNRVEPVEEAPENALEKVVGFGVLGFALYLTLDLNYRLLQAVLGEAPWPEEVGL